MAKKLSNVAFMPAIESISRKLALRRETCTNKLIQNNDEGGRQVIIPGHTYMGVSAQQVGVIGYGTVTKHTLFIRKPIDPKELTANQVTSRARFMKAVNWAREAYQDLSTIAANQNKFLVARKDFSKTIGGVSAVGYQTFRGWMCGVVYELDKQNNFPQTHALPEFDA